jgi:hypothetical protein
VRARAFSGGGRWARCVSHQPWLSRDTGPARSGGVSRWHRMSRSALACDVARGAQWAQWVRMARWARRGRSGCCHGRGDPCHRAGRGGSPAMGDHAGPDRAAPCCGGVAQERRTRGGVPGADSGNAGHGQASGRLLRSAAAGYAGSVTPPDACPSSCCRPTLPISPASPSVQPRGFAASLAWRLCPPCRHRRTRAEDQRTSMPACRPARPIVARYSSRGLRLSRSRPGGSPPPATSG